MSQLLSPEYAPRKAVAGQPDVRLLGTLMDCGRGENGLTEFLANLLRTTAILQAFLGEVLAVRLPEDVLGTATVTSEDEAACENGVPDVAIRVGDDLFVLIENKLGAPFTLNQPHEYLQSLKVWKDTRASGHAMLVIQGPDARIPALTEETWRLLGDRLPGLPRTATSYGGVEVRVVSWSDTRRALEGLSIEHPVVSYLLQSFLHLLPIVLESTSRIVTQEHLMRLNDKTVLDAVAAAEDVLSDVGTKLREKYEVKTERYELDFTFCGFCVYPRRPDGKRDEPQMFSVSLSARFGSQFCVSPLSMSLGPAYTRLDALVRAGWQVIPGADLARFGWDEVPTVPLKLTAGLEPVRQAEQIIAAIEEVRRIALRT